jgi:hypothetical protein
MAARFQFGYSRLNGDYARRTHGRLRRLTSRGKGERAQFACEGNDRFGRRFLSLTTAEKGKWRRVLNGQHGYPSDSEAILAVIGAMVVRHFTDEEIWQAFEDSPLFQARRERKGDKHARELVQTEIAKAREAVVPFDDDPGAAPVQLNARFAPHSVPIEAVDLRE